MLKLFKLFLFLSFYLLSLTFTFSMFADGQLGDVVYSYLDESSFVEQHGTGWVSFGPRRDIRNSDLGRLTKKNYLEKCDGYFIRNYGGNSGSIGKPQDYATARPFQSFKGETDLSGEHTHNILMVSLGAYRDKPEEWTIVTAIDHKSSNKFYPAISCDGDHCHQIEIKDGGDEETRPYNIALYTYIKINNDEGGKSEKKGTEDLKQVNFMWQNSFYAMQKEIQNLKSEIQLLKRKQ